MGKAILLGILCTSLLTAVVHASPQFGSLLEPISLRRRGLKPATPSAEIKGTGKQYTVTVGQAHSFKPTSLNASIGDFITFQFYPTKHSATLGDYDVPCSPWGYTHPTENDVWSGLMTVDNVTPNLPTWTYEVKSNNPQFFYCSAPGSCINYGMVFALNPNATQTLEHYFDGAKRAPYQLSPGEKAPSENGGTQANTDATPPQRTGLSTAAIAGIAVGGVAAIALFGILFFLIGRSRRANSDKKNPEATAVAPPPGSPMTPAYFEHGHPPPMYDGRAFSPAPPGASPHMAQTAWNDIYKPPLSPGFPNPRDSIYSGAASYVGAASPRPGYQSWAPSELSAPLPAPAPAVEIYTPGISDRQGESSKKSMSEPQR